MFHKQCGRKLKYYLGICLETGKNQ